MGRIGKENCIILRQFLDDFRLLFFLARLRNKFYCSSVDFTLVFSMVVIIDLDVCVEISPKKFTEKLQI